MSIFSYFTSGSVEKPAEIPVAPSPPAQMVPYVKHSPQPADHISMEPFEMPTIPRSGTHQANMAYVDATNGDNTTADLGNPDLPYKTVQAAVDAVFLQSPTVANPWWVYVRPGVYLETVTIPAYIYLYGSDRAATITSLKLSGTPITAPPSPPAPLRLLNLIASIKIQTVNGYAIQVSFSTYYENYGRAVFHDVSAIAIRDPNQAAAPDTAVLSSGKGTSTFIDCEIRSFTQGLNALSIAVSAQGPVELINTDVSLTVTGTDLTSRALLVSMGRSVSTIKGVTIKGGAYTLSVANTTDAEVFAMGNKGYLVANNLDISVSSTAIPSQDYFFVNTGTAGYACVGNSNLTLSDSLNNAFAMAFSGSTTSPGTVKLLGIDFLGVTPKMYRTIPLAQTKTDFVSYTYSGITRNGGAIADTGVCTAITDLTATDTYTVVDGDSTIIIENVNTTITLPDEPIAVGRVIVIKNLSGFLATIVGTFANIPPLVPGQIDSGCAKTYQYIGSRGWTIIAEAK